ncbi:Zinc knuckle family protein, putative isoform 2 [Cucumis melo var. makuwa]|uniref:Zinc knuckle family protein, putative isoform 2 n=1 Tax=Cucumis melo var. makuwa TaxID=1194695 RepID=A0A5D3DBA1_CUCMM|nr:Zinc knuckle family protein, putative isoform 2 [Cucumis melo var. makuwa]
MNDETRRKIEENVIEVLKQSNIEDTTEFKVRSQVEERIGIDLSNKQCKLLVRNVVESFLLSMSERVCMGKEDEPGPSVRYENRAVEQKIIPKKEFNDDGDLLICRLSNNRSVTIHKFKGERMVSIRQYYAKDGKQLPTLKGISMPTEQWSVFKSNIPAIAEAILQMKRNKRSEHDADKIGAISNPTRVTYPKFPIETIRFDGKNYHAWAHQMELLLQDLKIAYVLSNQCPTAVLGAESSSGNAAQSKVAEQKWMSDDHMCHRNILNSLSDRLFNEYSKKPMSASELWKELKLLYFLEEFGTKRSQVKKYLEFKMVEEKSILEQVEELNHIADSIGSAGTIIDEDFHVSAIISKLPLSWKNVWMSLMHEHYLPLSKLTDRLRIEEQLRTQKNSRLSRVSIGPNTRGQHHAANHPSKMGDPMPVTVPLRKKECQKEVKTLLCLDCGKEGHTSPNCPTKKVDN